MTRPRLILLIVIALLVAAFFGFDLDRHFTLDALRARQHDLARFRDQHPIALGAAYFGVYVAVAALSLPGALVLTLAGGAIFGLGWGTLLVSFASSVGALCACAVARYLLRDWVQARWGTRLEAINRGIDRDGTLYLLTLRLIPLFPFFIVNLVMGLTRIRLGTFYAVSQIGMLPATFLYVNAGTELAALTSGAGLLTPGLIGALVLLGVFPWIARFAVEQLRSRRALGRYPRPRHFDRNLVVIGAGSAGLVTAYIAAAARARVTLIERARMGGDCLNTGCVPSKALIRTARFLADAKHAGDLGIRKVDVEFDFADVMARVRRVITAIEPHDSVARYTALGVECLQGEARVTSPWTVEIAGRTLTTRAIVIATGAAPLVPPIPGLAESRYYTSETIWDLEALPRHLVVLGGGPIGCELAQCFRRLGARVTVVELAAQILPREDTDVSAELRDRLHAEGVEIRTGHRAVAVRGHGADQTLTCSAADGTEVAIPHDALLVALGRRARTGGFGLEALGIARTPGGTLEVDATLRTVIPTIYAAGDVVGPYQFTHVAAHQAWYAAMNALFGHWWRFKVDYSVIPWTTFTDPEVARVGLSEAEARAQGIAYESTRYGIDDLDRAIADSAAHGFVKVLTAPGRRARILGATVVGAHAGELITEFVTAMRRGITLDRMLGHIHVYPTFSEANRYVAGAWRRAHAPVRLLTWLERYQRARL